MRRTLVAVLAVVATLALTAASCGGKSSTDGVGVAARGNVVEVVDAPASVTAKAAASVTAPADGTLASLLVDSGSQVRAGQVLAVIDSPSAQAQLKQAKQALSAANSSTISFGGGVDL